jgi:hypothetical protein
MLLGISNGGAILGTAMTTVAGARVMRSVVTADAALRVGKVDRALRVAARGERVALRAGDACDDVFAMGKSPRLTWAQAQ